MANKKAGIIAQVRENVREMTVKVETHVASADKMIADAGNEVSTTNTDNAVITDIPVTQIPQYPQVIEIPETPRKKGRKPKDRMKRDFKTGFLVPHELYERLKECAWLERMTLNDLANIALENYCKAIEAKHKN